MTRKNRMMSQSALILAVGLAAAACAYIEVSGEGAHRIGSAVKTASPPAPNASPTRLPVGNGVRTTRYPDGAMESMEIFVDGRRQGYVLRWYPDGRLKFLTHYTDGIRDGAARQWDASGKMLACLTPEERDCLTADDADLAMASHGPNASAWPDMARELR